MNDNTQAALVITRLIDIMSVVARVAEEVNKVSEVIKRARSENREISKDEWAQLDAGLDAARERARLAIS